MTDDSMDLDDGNIEERIQQGDADLRNLMSGFTSPQNDVSFLRRIVLQANDEETEWFQKAKTFGNPLELIPEGGIKTLKAFKELRENLKSLSLKNKDYKETIRPLMAKLTETFVVSAKDQREDFKLDCTLKLFVLTQSMLSPNPFPTYRILVCEI